MSEEEFDFANGLPVVKTDFTIDEESVAAWGEHDLCWDNMYSVNVEEFTFDSVDTEEREGTLIHPGQREYEFTVTFGGEEPVKIEEVEIDEEEILAELESDLEDSHDLTKSVVNGKESDDRHTYVCSIPDCDEEVRLDVKYRQIRHDCESCGAPRTFEVRE